MWDASNGNQLAIAALVCYGRPMLTRDKHERPKDIDKLAHRPVALSTSEKEDSITPPTKSQISAWMSEMGRKGGRIGGKRRMVTMTAKERSAVAKKAAQARWKHKEG